MAKLFAKLFVPTVAVSVLGLSTVVAVNPAFAKNNGNSNGQGNSSNNNQTSQTTQNSQPSSTQTSQVTQPSSNTNTSNTVSQTSIINSPNGKAISNVVLYLKDNSGTITKVKIDNFSDVSGEAKTYDATSILQKYPNTQLVAYTVKAGSNESGMGPGEGELFLIKDSGVSLSQLQNATLNETNTYQYKNIYNIASSSNTSNNTATTTQNQTSTASNNTTATTQSETTTASNNTTATTQSETTTASNNTTATTQSETSTASNNTTATTQSETTTASNNTTATTQSETSTASNNTTATTQSETMTASNSETTSTPESETMTASNSETTSTPESETTTTYFEDKNQVTQNMQPQTPDTQTVPEPGTIAALAFFGLGGLVAKKKAKTE